MLEYNMIYISSIMSSDNNLAKREKYLLKAMEDFVNTGPTKNDWLVLRRRRPGFLPDDVYRLQFDRVIELNSRYADLPVDDDLWAQLPDFLEDDVTIIPERKGPNNYRFVKFTLFPLMLQEEVRRLWRDPLLGTWILPWQFHVNLTGDYSLRRAALGEEDKSDERKSRGGSWRFKGPGACGTDEFDRLRRLMENFSLEVDWIAGRLAARFATDFQQACYALIRNANRSKVCGNPECVAPYFVASRATQKYCSEACVRQMQNESKLRWWDAVGKTRRQHQKRTSAKESAGRSNNRGQLA